VPVKGFNLSEEFLVVAKGDEDLVVGLDRLGEQRKWTYIEVIFLHFGLFLHLL